VWPGTVPCADSGTEGRAPCGLRGGGACLHQAMGVSSSDEAVTSGSMPDGPPLPEHPELRNLAMALETGAMSGEILDAKWRLVFISTEEARIVGVEPSEVSRFYGKGLPVRQLEDAEFWGTADDPNTPARQQAISDLRSSKRLLSWRARPRSFPKSPPDFSAIETPQTRAARMPTESP